MIVAEGKCKQCGVKVGGQEWRLIVVEYPYNPEWSPTTKDAGIFCGAACLARYLDECREGAQ